MARPSFVTPFPLSHGRCCPISHCHHRRPHPLHYVAIRPNSAKRFPFRRPPAAVQARTVSDDNDGELQDSLSPTPNKSFSVGVSIITSPDPLLRRQIIENIIANATDRVVVVTTAGLSSTTETDGLAPSTSPQANGVSEQDPQSPPQSEHSSAAVNNLEGWIACSSVDELVNVVLKLSAARECDYILAENTVRNDMLPQDLARILQSNGSASLRVDTLVSAFNVDTIIQNLLSPPPDSSTPDDEQHSNQEGTHVQPPHPIHDSAPQQPMMIASLIENSNVVVVRQCSSGHPEQMSQVHDIVSILNGSASIVPSNDDGVPINYLVNTNLYNNDDLKFGATWRKVLRASRAGASAKPALTKAVKEASFVYTAKRPFHPTRLYEHIKDVATFTGVIRSNGRIWLATRMLAPLEWNQASVAATLRLGKHFWAAVPEEEWPTSEEERSRIMANWDAQYGDRETEIVFVGIGIDKVRLQGLLDGCLLQDEEMVFNNMWKNFDDPFVEWVPLIEEEEEATEEEVPSSPPDTNPVPDVTDDAGQNSVAEQDSVEQEPVEHESVEQESVEVTAEKLADSAEAQDETDADTPTRKSDVEVDELPEDMYEQVSALEIFGEGFSNGELNLVPQNLDDEEYDPDDAIIASWDGEVADGILKEIPRKGLPITLLTGFLGSGKTTLLNYILSSGHGLRIAVLVNEIGEIDIDNQLIQRGEWDSNVVELANGCICCDMNEPFVDAIEKVLERKESIDYVIVETTGLADPGPVIHSLTVSDLAKQVRLDGVLTLVDAENFTVGTHMHSEAALSQILHADTILLSKTDLASYNKVEQLIEYIKELRPAARIFKSQRGRVPVNLILDVGMRIAEEPGHHNPDLRKAAVITGKDSKHEHDHDCGHDHDHDHNCEHEHSHDHDHDHDHDHEGHQGHPHSNHLEADGFVTTSFKSDRPLDTRLFMDNFLRSLPDGVFRAKGLLYFQGFDERYVFQLSGRRYHVEIDSWPDGVAPGNQLVIIGRDLDLGALTNMLEACHADAEEN